MNAEPAPAEDAPEGPLRFLLRRARPYRRLLIGALSASVASAILGLAPAVVIYGISQRVLSDNAGTTPILALAAAGFAAIAASLLLAAAANMIGHKIAFSLQRDLRLALLDRMAAAPVSRIEGKAGELKKIVLADVDRLEGLLAHVLPDLAAGLAGPLAGALVLASVDWRLMLAALALLPVAFLAQAWTWRGRAALFEEWNRTETQANAALLSYVRGIATLKAFDRQASTLANVTTAIGRLRDLAVTVTRRSRYPYSLFGSALSTNLLVVLPVALLLHNAGAIDRAGFVLAVVLGAGLTAPLNKVVFAATTLTRSAIAIDRVRELLDAPIIGDDGNGLLAEDNTIRFESVGFAYPGGRAVLQDVSLEIASGRLTAIVGPSGAGKSTLARLLPRFEDCGAGRITLGGVDIRDLPLAQLRSRIGMVFQTPLLFHGTIGDNLCMASPGASPDRLEDAAAAARIEQLADDPLALVVSDGGGLSGGERQRVAIARAVVKDAPILVLDEATAFIDAENEADVQAALSAAGEGRTVVVIAHRLASVVHADQIVVLADGRVEACGQHAELVATSPTYSRLWSAQQGAAGWKLAGTAP